MATSKDLQSRHAHRLLQSGTLLLLFSLLTGLAIPEMPLPRAGLSAHVVGLTSGALLIAIGLLWARLQLANVASAIGSWSAIYSAFAGWLMPLLAAVWNAGGKGLPLTLGALRGSPFQESVIQWGLVTAGGTMLTAISLVLWGLRKGPTSAAISDKV